MSLSGHAPTMIISDPSMISKWENLQNSRAFKYLFSSLYIKIINSLFKRISQIIGRGICRPSRTYL